MTDDIHNCHNNLRDSAAARKNFEGDLRKIDKWCRETEMRCATTPSLDASVELLKEQSVHYEVSRRKKQIQITWLITSSNYVSNAMGDTLKDRNFFFF